MPRPTKRAMAEEAWGLMMAVVATRPGAAFEIAAGYGLTPGDAKALISLDDESAPPTMGTLAGAWACDASNVTWLVDRLERSGLVERHASTTDRRAKTVALTPRGVEARDRIRAAFSAAPQALIDLTVDDLEGLCAVLRKTDANPKAFEQLMRSVGGPHRGGSV